MHCLSVCFLFLLGASLLNHIDAESGNKWGILFNSFFNNGVPGIAIQNDNPQDSLHARVKRAIYAALGWTQNCNSGWTGTYCETPMCTTPNSLPSSNTMSNQLVDRGNLGNGCAQPFAFPVEANVRQLTVTITTPSGSPKITLIDNNNDVVIQNVGNLPTAAIALLTSPPAGYYYMNVSVDDSQVFYCNFNIEVMTYLSVTTGFVSTPQGDSVDNIAIYDGEPNYFIAHAVNVSSPGKLGALFIRINGSITSTYTASLAPRYGCGYEYFAGMYSCQSENAENYWVVEGTDGFGYRFRRSSNFYCLIRPTPPTTPLITTPPPTSCLNGGTLVAVNTSTAFCYCGEFYSGYDCALPVCMNGGTSIGDGKCDCQFGYNGAFCEHVTCNNDDIGNFLTDYKTLIVVLRQSNYIIQQIPSIQRTIADEINYYGVNDITLYNNFILVTFGNDQISWLEYYSSFEFFKSLNSTTAVANTGCNDTVVDAISKVFLATAINNKSPILVFTDVPADDEADYLTVVFYNTFRKLPVFIYYMSDPSSSCNIDTLSPGYRTLNRIAHTSGGLVFTPTQTTLINIVKYSMRHMTYKRQWVLGYDYFQCQMGNHGSFFVDSATKTIAIMATGTNLTIQVTDPAGNSSLVIDILVADSNDYIWHIQDVIHGAYLFFITSSGGSTMPCNYRVYIESQYDLFYGISESLLTDATFSEPIFNRLSNVVAVLNGLLDRVTDQFRLFSEIQISRANNSGHLEPVYYSNGIYRDGCNFHLYFGAFTCDIPGEHLYLTVFADDERGYPIQRTAVAYCAYEQPTDAPPGTCLHGGVPNPYNTSSCLCPTYWSGQYCQNLYCDNNGTAVNNLYCQCPPYTDGRYCDVVSCDSPSSSVDFGFTHRSLVFVLNVQNSMASALTDLASQVQNLVIGLITMHTMFITKFAVITYNQTQAQILKSTDDPFGFIASVQYAAELASGQTPATNCTGLLDQAIVLGVDESLTNSFVFVFTDAEDSQGLASTDWIVAMGNAQDLRTRIYLVSTSNTLCGGTNGYQFNNHHIQMVEYTEGDLFYTTHPGNLLQFIPTLYKSGLFAGATLTNCSGEGYLPVDYWAQSFTIYTGGQNLQVSVTPPSGTETDYLHIIDSDTYLDIRQYIIPCDSSPNWRPTGAYCYIYITNSTTWQAAHDDCHVSYGAHMVHIFNQATQDVITSKIGSSSIWLGLQRDGNSTTFYWDVPDDAPYTIPLSGYTNWEPTQNQSDPSTGNCVMVKPGSSGQPKWWTADCNAISTTTMCQKHRYDQDFIPGRDENLLPAGLWLVKITGTGSCEFSANIQSEIQVFYGFTSNLHSDIPKSHADLARTDNRFIATVTGLDPIDPNSNEDSIDGNLNYAYIYDNETLVSTATFQRRTLCSYKTVSQTFACPQSSSYLTQIPVQFTGIDQFGNLFERIGTPYCSIGVVSCQHGGYLYNGQCICPPLFEGEACEIRICMNGGTLMPNGECQCTEETAGESCEYFQCIPPRKVDFTDNGKTLVILLETSFSMTTAMYKIRRNLPAIINNITTAAGAPQWFTNYILFPFDSTQNQAYWYNKTYATDIQSIANAIDTNWFYTCPGGSCVGGDQCPRPILQVINDTLNDPKFVTPNSVILLLTQSTVEDVSKYDSVFANIQNTRAQIQVILPDITSPCNLPWTDGSNRVLFAIPQMTGGNLFTVYSQDLVNSLLPLYLPSLYRSAVIDSLVVRNCSRDEIFISIDSRTPEITVVYSGVNPTLTLVDPTNNSVTLPPNAISSIFNYFGVVKTSGKGGTYKLIGTSDSAAGTCLINIHADSNIELSVGFVQPNDAYNGLTNDDAHWVAVADPTKSNVIVIHTNNVTSVSIDYVQLYSPSLPGRAQMFTSEVIPRSSDCSYQWVSVRGFYCDPFTTYELAVFGTDERSFVFRRSLAVHCVPDLPPRPPTPPTCDVTSRFYDIVVIIDGGQSSDFNTLKNLMISTFSPFTLNVNNTRLSVVVVNANATVQNYLIDSDGKLPPTVINAATTDGSAGQNLLAALQTVIGEYQNMNTTGYRPTARHLVVYASSNTNFTGGDPVDTLLSMKRSGMFGLVSVGYNLNAASATALENFSGPGCTYSDSSQNAAVNIANFVQDITCFRFPICGE